MATMEQLMAMAEDLLKELQEKKEKANANETECRETVEDSFNKLSKDNKTQCFAIVEIPELVENIYDVYTKIEASVAASNVLNALERHEIDGMFCANTVLEHIGNILDSEFILKFERK